MSSKTGKARGSSSVPQVARTAAEMRAALEPGGNARPVVGLVPTMGSLHEGHLSLMRRAREECDLVVVSIFINPLQFGPAEDFDSYPTDIEGDMEKLAAAGVDFVFAPAAAELYPQGFETSIETGSVAEGLCGQNRPGHFRGVATVVAKFLNIVTPDKAYFGQKDAQQLAVIRRMARDLDFNTDIVACPTVRGKDGLALSSRNQRLSSEEREQATALFQALSLGREAVEAGETEAARVRRAMRKKIGMHFMVEYEYARVVDPETMDDVDSIDRPVLLAVAATVGRSRLIDNMTASPPGGE